MKKSIRIVKRLLALFLVVLMSINTLGAIVSDNDGSAFIIKAEFDSLKNDFQKQIDQYNTSIDSKIDSAIANYLSGVKVEMEPKNYFDVYVGANGGSPLFAWNLPGTGVQDHPAKVDVFFDKEFAYQVYKELKYSGYLWEAQNGNQGTSAATACIDGGIIFGNDPNWSGSNAGWINLWKRAARPTTKVDSNVNNLRNFPINVTHGAWNPSSSITDMLTTIKTKVVRSNEFLSPTDAPVWTVLSDNGKNSLYLYQTNMSPYLVLNVHRHVYKDFASLTTSYYMSDGGKIDYDTAKTTINVGTTTNYGEKIDGHNYTGTSTTIGNYVRQSMQKLEVNDGVDYRKVVFPIANTNIYYLPTVPELKLQTSDTSQNIDDQNWYDIYWADMTGGKMQTNKLYGVTLKYKRPTFTALNSYIGNFEIPSITSLIGETIYHGDGFPLLKATSDDTNIKLRIKMKNSLNDTSNVTCLFSDKKLKRNSFDASASIKTTSTFALNSEEEISFSGLKKDDVLWINPVSGTGDYVYIDSISITKA